MKNYYEIVFIVRQDATSNLVEAVAAEITGVIKNSGGDVSKTEFCGLRTFAYPIKKSKKGHYVLLNVVCDGGIIYEVERLLRINESVLRYLTVRVDKLDNTPSALMHNNHYRENAPVEAKTEELEEVQPF
jgi:small subunit ribosomal protein S6